MEVHASRHYSFFSVCLGQLNVHIHTAKVKTNPHICLTFWVTQWQLTSRAFKYVRELVQKLDYSH